MSLARYLSLIAWLKWTLTVRWFQRSPGGAVATAVALFAIASAIVLCFFLIGLYLRSAGQADTAPFLHWTLWIATLLWLFAPLSQFDAQRSLDLTGLRLLPLTRARFSLTVLLDGLLGPLGAVSLLGALAALAAFSRNWLDALLLLPCLLLLGLVQLGCAQALYLLGNRIFSSRRFGEISMALGLLLFMGIQLLNLLLQGRGTALPIWLLDLLAALRGMLQPLGQWLAPGQAVQAFTSASQGWWLSAARAWLLLAAQAGLALAAAGWAARMFYEGELESGGAVKPQPAVAAGRRRWLAGHWHGLSFAPALAALLERERNYLWRDPLVKLQLLQSLFGSLYIAVVALMLNLQQSSDMGNLWLERGGKYVLLGIALMLGLSESAILFNKFGYEGGQLANLLITPVSRRTLLVSKSVHLVGHFLPLNLMLALMAGLALHAPPLFIALALLLVVTSTMLLDLVGHYLSIYYPFSYRRVGRRLRAVMPQPGCGYVMVYMLVFQLCHVLTMPVAAVSIALTLLLQWPGFALAVVFSAGAAWAAYRYGLDEAARRLSEREQQLLEMLSKPGE